MLYIQSRAECDADTRRDYTCTVMVAVFMGYLYNLEEAPARRVRRDVRGLLRTSLLLPRTRGTNCDVLNRRKYAYLLACLFSYGNLVRRYGWYRLIKIGEEWDEYKKS